MSVWDFIGEAYQGLASFVAQNWIELAILFAGIALIGWLMSEVESAPLEEPSEAEMAIVEAERWLKECRSQYKTEEREES